MITHEWDEVETWIKGYELAKLLCGLINDEDLAPDETWSSIRIEQELKAILKSMKEYTNAQLAILSNPMYVQITTIDQIIEDGVFYLLPIEGENACEMYIYNNGDPVVIGVTKVDLADYQQKKPFEEKVAKMIIKPGAEFAYYLPLDDPRLFLVKDDAEEGFDPAKNVDPDGLVDGMGQQIAVPGEYVLLHPARFKYVKNPEGALEVVADDIADDDFNANTMIKEADAMGYPVGTKLDRVDIPEHYELVRAEATYDVVDSKIKDSEFDADTMIRLCDIQYRVKSEVVPEVGDKVLFIDEVPASASLAGQILSVGPDGTYVWEDPQDVSIYVTKEYVNNLFDVKMDAPLVEGQVGQVLSKDATLANIWVDKDKYPEYVAIPDLNLTDNGNQLYEVTGDANVVLPTTTDFLNLHVIMVPNAEAKVQLPFEVKMEDGEYVFNMKPGLTYEFYFVYDPILGWSGKYAIYGKLVTETGYIKFKLLAKDYNAGRLPTISPAAYVPEIEEDGDYVTATYTFADNNIAVDTSFASLPVTYVEYKGIKAKSMRFQNCNKLESAKFISTDVSLMNSFANLFSGCLAMTSVDLKGVQKTLNVNTMQGMFMKCQSLKTVDLSTLTTTAVTNMSNMFNGCSALTGVGGLNTISSALVTTTANMFKDCVALETLNMKNFKTPAVKYMNSMFENCEKLNYLDITSMTTDNVMNMNSMFKNCAKLTKFSLTKWVTTNCTNMGSMFNGCRSVVTLDLGKFDTKKVTNMGSMFKDCAKLVTVRSQFETPALVDCSFMFDQCAVLKTVDVSKFNTSKVTNFQSMFAGCATFTALDLSNFNTDLAISVKDMFRDCTGFKSLRLDNFKITADCDYSGMLTNHGALTYTAVMKTNCDNDTRYAISTFFDYLARIVIKSADGTSHMGDITGASADMINHVETAADGSTTETIVELDTTPVGLALGTKTDITSVEATNAVLTAINMGGDTALTTFTTKNVDTSGVTTLANAFTNCTALTDIVGEEDWDTSGVTSLNSTFNACSSLAKLDVSGWDTSKVTSLASTFNGCTALGNVATGEWDTPVATDMSNTFKGCSKMTAIDISGWTTDSVTTTASMFENCEKAVTISMPTNMVQADNTDISYMFAYCRVVKDLGSLSGWDTSGVTTMSRTFMSCQTLTALKGMNNWDVSKVTDMRLLFGGADNDVMKLSTIEITNWKPALCTTTRAMFQNCRSMTKIDLSNWKVDAVTDSSYMFYGCHNLYYLYLTGLNFGNVADVSSMFYNCYMLKDMRLSNCTMPNTATETNFMNVGNMILTYRDVVGGCTIASTKTLMSRWLQHFTAEVLSSKSYNSFRYTSISNYIYQWDPYQGKYRHIYRQTNTSIAPTLIAEDYKAYPTAIYIRDGKCYELKCGACDNVNYMSVEGVTFTYSRGIQNMCTTMQGLQTFKMDSCDLSSMRYDGMKYTFRACINLYYFYMTNCTGLNSVEYRENRYCFEDNYDLNRSRMYFTGSTSTVQNVVSRIYDYSR